MIHDNKIFVSIILLMAFSTAYTIIENLFQVALSQTESLITTDKLDTANQTKVPEGEQTINSQQQQQQTFRSTFDTFVTAKPQAYGIYD